MSHLIAEALPPDLLQGERGEQPPLPVPAPLAGLPPGVLGTLAAHAYGARRFPQLALVDVHAAPLLRALGVDAEPWLADRAGVYRELARSRLVCGLAQTFFAQRPHSIGIHLGAGLSHHFQWLDNGRNGWIDAERHELSAMRRRLIPPGDERHLEAAVDLNRRGWWHRLALPSGPNEAPLFVLLEAASMDLGPTQMQAVLAEVGTLAPPGTRVIVDTAWRSGGHALSAAHPRLFLDACHDPMAGYGLHFSWLPALRGWVGLPSPRVAELGVGA